VHKTSEDPKPELLKKSWTIDLKISRELLILAAVPPKVPKHLNNYTPHNYCEEYKGDVHNIVLSCERCEDEGYTSEELLKLVKSLSVRMEELVEDFARHSYEEDAKDILVLETYVLGIPAYDEELISNNFLEQPLSLRVILSLSFSSPSCLKA
jgi:hypothetical protein